MPVQITVKNLQRRIRLNPRRVIQKTKKILKKERVLEAELSLAFVTDQKIKTLNKKYLRHDYVTDVLAFDLRENLKDKKLVGEIVISTGRVAANAKKYGAAQSQELILYVIHGILHLLGYRDHEPKDTWKMRKKEEDILKWIDNAKSKSKNQKSK